jgi:HD superfamily phosphohydrolase
MKSLTFADVAHHFIYFDATEPGQRLIIKLLDSAWMQRLRDVSQTANTRLVYMFSEHSRFGHSLGVAYLANLLMDHLAKDHSDEVKDFRAAVSAAALLHDIGHLAPGSHTAFKIWFPGSPDEHEKLAIKIIKEDHQISELLNLYSKELSSKVCAILMEEDSVPAWTWEIISGGGWNVDRGNWCIVDSTLAGVSYGKYNVAALIDAMEITSDGHLAVKENRLDALMHFAVSRHAMYRQVYQHRVLLAADVLNKALVQRARAAIDRLVFCDKDMSSFLSASSIHELSLSNVFHNREAWWRYHLLKWTEEEDKILKDLALRLLNRGLFKTLRIKDDASKDLLYSKAATLLEKKGYDPEYYLHLVSSHDVHAGDFNRSMLVRMDNGKISTLREAESLYESLVTESKEQTKRWLVLPKEIKDSLTL